MHGFERRIGEQDLLDDAVAALPDGDLRLGIEDQHMSVRTFDRLREALPARVELVPAGGGRRAAADGQGRGRGRAHPRRGRAGRRGAAAARSRTASPGAPSTPSRSRWSSEMRRLGAERPSFDTIVAHAAHGALPHAVPREVEIATGSLVTIDWGAQLDGYCSDCTRTFAVGEPGERAREVYELVLSAQRAGLDAVRPGVSGRDADAARASADRRGRARASTSATGSGTASAWRSTRRRGCRERPTRRSPPATS